ncbi:universal stress protein UspA-like nucleotide-binding protein [gamma proteobacterium BDW918]|jgi:nucleotide-binding universal stress UspA family protein|uniref:Universal stress protein UspA n=1 Tax=Zhongshania aliphaticivorans TaxID=1470434 RepID=A0A127M1Z6_9GAMM|nr:universal stress protein [Zhongshania aliphaticivorans]AMO67230.1 universal stress protein UspA [Zhongshania aliphaticivorans]EIF44080.1 universal stress protein UspA-like nucleotide-binding protein [gamma proteobacterium BDW918]|tara:strand:- start:3213 stop:4061 length:849 start_codon:yes stop_codon:yes gene_type:complete
MNNNYILGCIDGASLTTAVCDYTAWLSDKTGAPVKLLHNLEHRPQAPLADLSGSIGLGSQEELLEELIKVEQHRSRLLMEKGKLMLDAARRRVEADGVSNIETWQRNGSLQETLVEHEEEIRVLVMGVRGDEHREGQLGAHLETVIRALHKPVLVVNKEFTAPKKVMLAYDGQDAAQKALDMMVNSPLFKDISCHLVYVGEEQLGEDLLLSASSILAKANIQHTTVCLQGRGDEVLCQYQIDNEIDMTVMGAYSHHPLRNMLLGSFTAKMLQKNRQPLLLLR